MNVGDLVYYTFEKQIPGKIIVKTKFDNYLLIIDVPGPAHRFLWEFKDYTECIYKYYSKYFRYQFGCVLTDDTYIVKANISDPFI